MADYGLTEAGFKLKRLRTILDEMKVLLQNVKDPDTGENLVVNFDEDDPFIQFINISCDELSAVWEILNAVVDQFDPNKASGPMLSGLVQLNGIVRKKGTPSTVTVHFTGSQGVFVPKDTRVTDSAETIIWKTSVDATVASVGYVDISCNSSENGSFSAPSGTINVLMDAIDGITAVVNTSASVTGIADESDIALRKRRAKSTETPSVAMAESLYGSIASLDEVTYCKVYTNRTLVTDANGIPAKSVSVVVQGGDDEEIAKTIFTKSSMSESYYGDTAIDVTDSLQQTTTVRFQRPTNVPIEIELVVDEIEGAEFPADFVNLITNNIINYAANGIAGLGIATSESSARFDNFGFPPSENIVASRLYVPILAVGGLKIVSLQIGTVGGTLGTADIEIDWDEIGQFLAENMTITKQV